MEIAVAAARHGIEAGQSPFGAAVFAANGTLIAVENNQVRAQTDPTAHAEVTAIRTACAKIGQKKLPGHWLYSTCEPCPMCAAAIAFAGIRHVAFGASVRDAIEAGYSLLQLPCRRVFNEIEDEMTIEEGVLVDRCVALFEQVSHG
jgi:tRNA(Arg) A34 adenosine deaminase TadA